VRCLLGWSAPAHAWRIRVGATPLGDLAAREFVLFVSYISEGLRGGYANAKQNFQPHKTKNYRGYRSWNYH
jgi:hypothetical protein